MALHSTVANYGRRSGAGQRSMHGVSFVYICVLWFAHTAFSVHGLGSIMFTLEVKWAFINSYIHTGLYMSICYMQLVLFVRFSSQNPVDYYGCHGVGMSWRRLCRYSKNRLYDSEMDGCGYEV